MDRFKGAYAPVHEIWKTCIRSYPICTASKVLKLEKLAKFNAFLKIF
jgi:hypothetical protein